jgi:HEPN domain-containing protein
MKKIAEEWLKAAADDLEVVVRISSDENLTHMVAFHSQQCIEKSLKAVLEEHEMGSVRIHNLERLFEIVRDYIQLTVDPVLTEMLDKLYVDARYPGDLGLLPSGKPTLEYAEKFHDFARAIYETIQNEMRRDAVL